MTPEQHYRRGLELLDNADWCRGNGPASQGEAQVDAVVAQAHFGAAAAGSAMRALELMANPPRVVAVDPPPSGATDG